MKKVLLLTFLTLLTNSVVAETIKSEKVILFNDTDCKANQDIEEGDCKYKFLYSYDKSGIDFIDKELLSSFGFGGDNIEKIKQEIAKSVAEEKQYMQESITGASAVVETKFLNQRTNLVQYVSHNSSYSAGAAHGMFGDFYYIFDLELKKRLRLKDILISGKEQALIKVLEKSLGQYFLEFSSDNDSPDYKKCLNKKKTNKTTCAIRVFAINPKPFDDLYETADNFYFTDKGLAFNFPPYVVAAFAYGEVGFEIDKKDLKGIINDKLLK